MLALLPWRMPAAESPGATAELSGYLLAPNEKVPESYDGGFSLHVAAWPLLPEYPGNRHQSGLFGTWMHARQDTPVAGKLYSDIEGGLGWWRDTRFATSTPKFIMGGVAPNFREWANGPGAGKGRDWSHPAGKYAVAQLSPWVLWPPDGLNLRQGTCGQLFGYGYLALPLIPPQPTTAGAPVPTGGNAWTLFLDTGNFKGPVAFFTPHFWARAAVENPDWAGRLLDTRPAQPNQALQMETQHIPARIAVDAGGTTYARIAPTAFPAGPGDRSLLVHRFSAYSRDALWKPVQAWLHEGGPPAGTPIAPGTFALHAFRGGGAATWSLFQPPTAKEAKVRLASSVLGRQVATDPHSLAYVWEPGMITRREVPGGTLLVLPEFYRLATREAARPEWVPVPAAEVPPSTGLHAATFRRPLAPTPEPYVTPDDPGSPWKRPGPVAGPFQVRPGDGSLVTYYWYRFADQPALLHADLTPDERERLQTRVVRIHRHWTRERAYLPPPETGPLADLDPALIVTPPPGLEAGYVPIVTRQEAVPAAR